MRRPCARALQEEALASKPKRIPSENSPAPPRVSPESLVLVTERRREKFHKKLARLLPIYKAPHVDTPLQRPLLTRMHLQEKGICMRDLWSLDMSDDEDGDEEDDIM